MNEPSERLLRVAKELTAISESALAYCRDPFDIDRFHRVGALARDLMSEVAAEDPPPYDREVASVAGYTTPKLDVRGGVFDADGRVLLVREVADGGRWTLPGGWCDILESPREAIEREVGELFPKKDWVLLNHRVIWHGRRRCHAQRRVEALRL